MKATDVQSARQRLRDLVTEELVQALEAQYPNVLPDKPLPSDELAMLIGQQAVIKHLRAILRSTGRERSNVLARPILGQGDR